MRDHHDSFCREDFEYFLGEAIGLEMIEIFKGLIE